MSSALGDVLDHDEKLVLDLFLAEFWDGTPNMRWAIGVYVSAIFLEPKEIRSRPKFGSYTARSRQYIEQVEERAKRKLRNWKCFCHDDLLCAANACRDYSVTV